MIDSLRTLLAKLITNLNIGLASLRTRAWLWLASATDNLEARKRALSQAVARYRKRGYRVWRVAIKTLKSKRSHLLSVPVWFLWMSASLRELLFFNLSFLTFLLLAQPPSPAREPDIIIIAASAELMRLLLSGWLFFTVFFRPGSRSPIPSAEIREDSYEIWRMFSAVGFVHLWRVVLSETSLRLLSKFSVNSRLSTPAYTVMGVVAVVWSMVRLKRWRGSRSTSVQHLMELPSDSTKRRALKKIEKKLTQNEQRQFAELLYQSEAMRHATVQNIAKVLWYSLIFALIREIVEEVGSRLLLPLLG